MRRSKQKGRPVAELDARHYRAIALLVDGSLSYGEIADSIGIDRRTLHRWRKRKDFDRELRKVLTRIEREWRRTTRDRLRLRSAYDMTWFFDAVGRV
ncbi:phBC6A51 family helix-turn-helix protein [Paenibacillus sp. 1781tsa1]|uniref:phBC6A51 family helix-turn-helix protein n=1 Tax=Paenibacillus sp. 1781tsa1 TaxID=2953810 RepID=UPI0020A03E05|nr:phBC6A51 family helix-turn-helix protein [Paenibacillus sp. 1781tsa1]MCP1186444.1 phBC6A51 family helix-turn-helix protein [Paenibacillus sp. 1781tsa1]